MDADTRTHGTILQRTISREPTGVNLYARFAFAGAASASLTHAVLTPFDVVKTRIQLDPHTYNGGMISTFRHITAAEGPLALLTGLGPTVAGYFLQGACKFGGYEFFKKQCVHVLGPETASDHRTAVYLASSALAEFFADIALCPLEATRIRLVAQPGFASGMVDGLTKIVRLEGAGALFSGFGPLLFKQVPYTVAQFVVFEKVNDIVASKVDKATLFPGSETVINFSCGLVAGGVAALVSQPADTMLSKINQTKANPGETTTGRLIKIARELGVRGSFTGSGPRLFMVGIMVAGQFAIYGDIKRLLHANGGIEISKTPRSP